MKFPEKILEQFREWGLAGGRPIEFEDAAHKRHREKEAVRRSILRASKRDQVRRAMKQRKDSELGGWRDCK